jgi:hypothetical protein
MLGPDAARYLLAGRGEQVARPFHLRWLLPAVCGDDEKLWRLVWLLSWPLVAAGCATWASAMGATWQQALAAAGFLVALPGVMGPASVRTVGVDLPSLAIGLAAAAAFANDQLWLGLVLVLWSATAKESMPVWVALWCWSLWPLVGLAAVAVAAVVRRPALDLVTARPDLKRVHDHPVRTAFEHRQGRWRDAWLWLAPWGATLAALVPPSPQVLVTLAVAHLQCLVATDQVRIVQLAAGPVMALAAAQHIPTSWLVLTVLVNFFFWWKPETV